MSWQITIHSLAGKLCEVTVDGSSLVCDVKTRVFEATGVPVSQQRLLCGTTELDDDYALESFADPCTELSLVRRPIEHVLWLRKPPAKCTYKGATRLVWCPDGTKSVHLYDRRKEAVRSIERRARSSAAAPSSPHTYLERERKRSALSWGSTPEKLDRT